MNRRRRSKHRKHRKHHNFGNTTDIVSTTGNIAMYLVALATVLLIKKKILRETKTMRKQITDMGFDVLYSLSISVLIEIISKMTGIENEKVTIAAMIIILMNK